MPSKGRGTGRSRRPPPSSSPWSADYQIPSVAQLLLLQVAEAWRVPLGVVRLTARAGGRRVAHVVPSPARLRRAARSCCRGFPGCFVAAARGQASVYAADPVLSAIACPARGRAGSLLLSPLSLAEDVDCFLVCGCLSDQARRIKATDLLSPRRSDKAISPSMPYDASSVAIALHFHVPRGPHSAQRGQRRQQRLLAVGIVQERLRRLKNRIKRPLVSGD